jgi:hypothetical protein
MGSRFEHHLLWNDRDEAQGSTRPQQFCALRQAGCEDPEFTAARSGKERDQHLLFLDSKFGSQRPALFL